MRGVEFSRDWIRGCWTLGILALACEAITNCGLQARPATLHGTNTCRSEAPVPVAGGVVQERSCDAVLADSQPTRDPQHSTPTFVTGASRRSSPAVDRRRARCSSRSQHRSADQTRDGRRSGRTASLASSRTTNRSTAPSRAALAALEGSRRRGAHGRSGHSRAPQRSSACPARDDPAEWIASPAHDDPAERREPTGQRSPRSGRERDGRPATRRYLA